MKTLLAATLLGAAFAPKDYPIKVKIEQTHWQNHHIGGASGHGFGNVKEEGKQEQGFDFVFDGCEPFEASHGPGFYKARWKDAHTLVLSTNEIGSDHTHECALKVSLRNFVYTMHDDHLGTRPLDR